MKKSLIAIELAVGLSVIGGGCTAQESRRSAAEWIGKDRAKNGPTQTSRTIGDGARDALLYSYEGHRYYFQTNAMGQIDSALRTD